MAGLTGNFLIGLQCSEPSGDPKGDGGYNAKKTGRVAQDGTAGRSLV